MEENRVQTDQNTGQETVLVTGATGFLGEYVVKRLTGKYHVLAMGRNTEKEDIWKHWGPGSARPILRTETAGTFSGVFPM